MYVTVNVSVLVLPAASRAVTVSTFAPLKSATLALQLAVPVAVPDPPRSFTQLTCVTPTASLAVPLERQRRRPVAPGSHCSSVP